MLLPLPDRGSTVSSPEAAPDLSSAVTSSRGGGIPAAILAASAAPRGGGIPPMSSSGAAAAGESWISSRGEDVLPTFSSARVPAASAAPRGGGHLPHVFIGSGGYVGGCGDIFPRWGYSRRGSSSGGDRWHTCKRERSRTAGGSGCVAYATRIRPFRWSWSSYRRTFSDGVGAGAAGGEWWA